MCAELPRQHAARLDEQGPVDRLVRHTHRAPGGVVLPERARNLLGRPVLPQSITDVGREGGSSGQEAGLRPLRAAPRAIIGVRGAVLGDTVIAGDLPTDRRRRPAELPPDRAKRLLGGEAPRDLLALGRRQRRHSAALRRLIDAAERQQDGGGGARRRPDGLRDHPDGAARLPQLPHLLPLVRGEPRTADLRHAALR